MRHQGDGNADHEAMPITANMEQAVHDTTMPASVPPAVLSHHVSNRSLHVGFAPAVPRESSETEEDSLKNDPEIQDVLSSTGLSPLDPHDPGKLITSHRFSC